MRGNTAKVCGSRSLTRIFGSRKDEVKGEWLSFHNGKSGDFIEGRMTLLVKRLGMQHECSIAEP